MAQEIASNKQSNVKGGTTYKITRALFQSQIDLNPNKLNDPKAVTKFIDELFAAIEANAKTEKGKVTKALNKVDMEIGNTLRDLKDDNHKIEPLTNVRERIDDAIVRFKPEDLRNFGAGYKQKNTDLSTSIDALETELQTLLKQHQSLSTLHAALQKDLRENKLPDKKSVAAYHAAANDFQLSAKNYFNKHSALHGELLTLQKSVYNHVSQADLKKGEAPTPRIS